MQFNPRFLGNERKKHRKDRGAAFAALGILMLLLSVATIVVPPAAAFISGQAASVVLGQPNFSGVSQYRASGPGGIAFDTAGNLWVADVPNNRILRFPAPLANGISADIVIGQTGFTSSGAATSQSGLRSPASISFDSSGNLWVVDVYNHRVLRFSPPFSSGMIANLVIGQSSFSSNSGSTTQSGLYYPGSVAFDYSGNLWVADCFNDRVIRFPTPFSNGMSANLVLGQPDFVSYAPATSQNGMSCPNSLTFDSSGYLWVGDYYNNRILRFGPQFSSGMSANLALGQPTFTGSAAAVSQSGTSGPWFLTFDSKGNLWVDDSGNFRVLEFAPPFANGMNAQVVLGQSSFTSNIGLAQAWFNYPEGVAFDSSGNLWVSDNANGDVLRFSAPFTNAQGSNLVVGQGQNSLTLPRGLFFDTSGNLWVGDSGNNRVLRFAPTFTSGMSANLVIGQHDLVSNAGIPTRSGLTSAGGVVLDSSGNLWVSDFLSNRILRFSPPFVNGMNASLVIGQSSFTSSSPSTTQSGLSTARYLTFDSAGNLWVSDQDNNRVLEFAPPFSNGMAAALVLGQQGFTVSAPATSQSGLRSPEGIAFDSSGNLWVADENNNRTLMFSSPFTNGMNSKLVLGQSSFATAIGATTQNGMSRPESVSFDPRGNLWVADQSNNRILRFFPPFTSGMNSNLVLGQAGFNAAASGTGASGLFSPRVVAFDSAGNLWTSSQSNNRVMQFTCGAECPPSSLSFSFSVQGGGTGYSAPTVTYLSGGIPRSTTLTGQQTAISIDYGSGWTVSGNLPGSGSGERWATAQLTSGTATTTQKLNFTYSHQFNATLGYSVTGGGTGYTAPKVNFTQFGSLKSIASGSWAWADSNSSYSYAVQLAGSSSSERWTAPTISGKVAAAGPITVNYFHQYAVNASYSVIGGGSPQAPVLSSMQFGATFSTTVTNATTSYWLDNGASWSVTNPLGGSTSSERWQTNATAGTITQPVALTSLNSRSIAYLHQFMLTISASPTSGGSVSPASNWLAAGSSVSLAATPGQGYQFLGWTGSGTGAYTGPNNPASVSMSSPITEVAGFVAAVTTSSTTSTTTTPSASTTTTQSSTGGGGGGGIPEFPAQLAATVVFTAVLVASFLAVRRRAPRRSGPNLSAGIHFIRP